MCVCVLRHAYRHIGVSFVLFSFFFLSPSLSLLLSLLRNIFCLISVRVKVGPSVALASCWVGPTLLLLLLLLLLFLLLQVYDNIP